MTRSMICLGFVNTNCTASVPQIFYTRKRKRGNKMLTLASDNLSQSEKFKELSCMIISGSTLFTNMTVNQMRLLTKARSNLNVYPDLHWTNAGHDLFQMKTSSNEKTLAMNNMEIIIVCSRGPKTKELLELLLFLDFLFDLYFINSHHRATQKFSISYIFSFIDQ